MCVSWLSLSSTILMPKIMKQLKIQLNVWCKNWGNATTLFLCSISPHLTVYFSTHLLHHKWATLNEGRIRSSSIIIIITIFIVQEHHWGFEPFSIVKFAIDSEDSFPFLKYSILILLHLHIAFGISSFYHSKHTMKAI